MKDEHRALAIALAVAAVLYWFGIGSAPYWYDETGSVWMASLPWPQLVAATAGDTHPPLYLLLLSVVQWVLGAEPWAMRLLSAACGLGVVAITWAIARELRFSPAALWLGLGWVVFSAWQVYYAQEARMYTMFQLLALGALWAALRTRLLLFVLLSALSLYTHNYGLLYLAVNCGVLVWACYRPTRGGTRWPFIGAVCTSAFMAVAAVFPWLPWAQALAGQMRIVEGGYWIQPVTVGMVADVLYQWLGGAYTPPWLMPSVVILAAGLAAFGAVRACTTRDEAGLILLWMVAAPVALAVVVSLAWRPMFLFRGFAPSAPLFGLLAAWAITQGTRWPQRAVALTLTGPVMAAALVGYYTLNRDNKGQAYADAYATVAAHWQPGDVLVSNQEGGVMGARYSALAGRPAYLMPRCGLIIGGLSDTTRAAMGMEAADPAALPWSRVWFVLGEAPTIPACNVEASHAFLAAHRSTLWATMREDEFVLAQVWLVQR